MSLLLRRAVAIPVWAVLAVALGVGAVSAPALVTPALSVLLGLALIGFSALLIRWVRKSRPPRIDVLPALGSEPPPEGLIVDAGVRGRTFNEAVTARNAEAEEAADLMRMDDDVG